MKSATSATQVPALSLSLAGGGTGGHVVPGLRVLERLMGDPATRPERVLWFVAGRAVESTVLEPLGELLGDVPYRREVLGLEPPGSGAPSRLRLCLRLVPETLRARRALRAHGSNVLLGLGGFTSLPAVLAARSLGIKIVLLEVNAVPGKATRWLGRFADRVVYAWSTGMPAASGDRHVRLGPPLAAEVFATPGDEVEAAAARVGLGLDPKRALLVVLGGSQGAASLNRFLHDNAVALVAAGIQVVHQTGPGRLAEGSSAFFGYEPREYVVDVPRLLCAATLVLCRGGASTLAEVAAAARPALVVPYPYSPDRHQEKNARELGDGVELIEDDALDEDALTRVIELADLGSVEARAERRRRANALAAAVPRDGAQRLATLLVELAR